MLLASPLGGQAVMAPSRQARGLHSTLAEQQRKAAKPQTLSPKPGGSSKIS